MAKTAEYKPIVIQNNRDVLLEETAPNFQQARTEILKFAELVKSPGLMQTYRLSDISLWNAQSIGVTPQEIVAALQTYSRNGIPEEVRAYIDDVTSRYGKFTLKKVGADLHLTSTDDDLSTLVREHVDTSDFLDGTIDDTTMRVKPEDRGHIKRALTKLGYPVEDLAGYTEGESLEINLRKKTRFKNEDFTIWPYQNDAASVYHASGSVYGGSGVVCLPCGAGKTVVALDVMSRLKCNTLILVHSVEAARQWIDEIIDKTDIDPALIGEYSGSRKEIKPITVATYQSVASREKIRQGELTSHRFKHFGLFDEHKWGLIVYDEVQKVPAPIVRITAEIQATRRLGLTATLTREDDLIEDIFSLIGPKKYDIPWRVLEEQGYIAKALCNEIRVPLDERVRDEYDNATQRNKHPMASANPAKIGVLKQLLDYHRGDQRIIIGFYKDQLHEIGKALDLPVIDGDTPPDRRVKLYRLFKEGKIDTLLASNVCAWANDFPKANVMIEVSGQYGSSLEEAQRLGRVIRRKEVDNTAFFYRLVTVDSAEQDFSRKRQRFLVEQGYQYFIVKSLDELIGLRGWPKQRFKGEYYKPLTSAEIYRLLHLPGDTGLHRRRASSPHKPRKQSNPSVVISGISERPKPVIKAREEKPKYLPDKIGYDPNYETAYGKVVSEDDKEELHSLDARIMRALGIERLKLQKERHTILMQYKIQAAAEHEDFDDFEN